MQFQAVNIFVQTSGSLVNLWVRVPFLEALVGYAQTSATEPRLGVKESHV